MSSAWLLSAAGVKIFRAESLQAPVAWTLLTGGFSEETSSASSNVFVGWISTPAVASLHEPERLGENAEAMPEASSFEVPVTRSPVAFSTDSELDLVRARGVNSGAIGFSLDP